MPPHGNDGMNRRMFGLDSETPMGNLKVLATNEEVIEVDEFDDILGFLSKHRYQGSIMWTFNLDFDINHILKTSGDIDFLRDLYDNGAQRPGIDYRGYRIQYIGSKLFKVCKNGNCFTIYDIAQFYMGATLDQASKQYLGVGKLKGIDARRLGEEPGYYESHKPLTLDYCKVDAIRTLQLARLMGETFVSRGISFRNPLSMAKISENYISDNRQYPRVLPVHTRYHGAARLAYHGGMFWTLKRGYFHQPLYAFDLNSAYPSVMTTLPHWANGHFKDVDEPTGARFGWFGCQFDCQWIPQFEYQEQMFTQQMGDYEPVEVVFNNRRKIYPTGLRRQWITAVEYRWMKEHGFKCDFYMGCEWQPVKDEYQPPFDWMADMYKERKQLQKQDGSDMRQYALKILLNGGYGKTAQSKHRMGRMTNFFYASYITAETRLKVAEVAMRHPNEVIDIATDSVTLTSDISAELNITEELGDWSKKEYAEGLFIGSGMRQNWYKEPLIIDGKKILFGTYARGLTDKRDYDLKAAMEANRSSPELFFTKKRPIKLGEMLQHHKILGLKDLGVFMDVKKNLRVNTDTKSIWPRDYETFGDFLDSLPMSGKPLEVTI